MRVLGTWSGCSSGLQTLSICRKEAAASWRARFGARTTPGDPKHCQKLYTAPSYRKGKRGSPLGGTGYIQTAPLNVRFLRRHGASKACSLVTEVRLGRWQALVGMTGRRLIITTLKNSLGLKSSSGQKLTFSELCNEYLQPASLGETLGPLVGFRTPLACGLPLTYCSIHC